ncbi:MAG: hypothetical protein M3R45_07025 [Pseudomonadota bacterium]|nr:hypothetical protein [Pseudomonadota bacterium]
MNSYTKMLPWGAVLALTVMSAAAQTTPPASAPATPSTPGTVGVTPGEAAEANRQAVPRSDTGTVVRTAPSAADRAGAALDSGTTDTTGVNADGSPTRATGTPTVRRPRADRN